MIKNIAGQLVFFFVVFMAISMIRETSLLGYSDKMPDFELPNIEGKKVSSTELNDKPTLIFFWAPWCSVCKVSMPNLEDYYQANKDKVNVLTIALDYSNKAEVVDLLTSKSLTLPTLLGTREVAEKFKIQGYPTYYVIDREGQVHAKSLGYASFIGMKARTLTL